MANKQAFGSPMDPEGVMTDRKRPIDDEQDARKLNVIGGKDVERERNQAPGRSEDREGVERRHDDVEGRERDIATERQFDHDLEDDE